MIQNGLHPRWSDKRDLDFLKSHQLGAISAPTVYKEFDFDPGFPMLDQNAMGYPYGCTGFAQADLCSAEDEVQYDPADIYNRTPPLGQPGGRDMRASLSVICKTGVRKMGTQDTPGNPRKGYFSIRAQGMLDWFDALYISALSTANEEREISIGIPWFPEFENPVSGSGGGNQHVASGGILPIPIFDIAHASWHNAVVARGKFINGVYYLGIKSWQGPDYGDKGWCYMSKELANAIFNINGTEAFTVSKVTPGQTQTIDLTFIEYIVSFFSNLLTNLTKKKLQTQ